MPLDPDIPFRAIAGLTKAQPYDPVAVQTDIDRQRVHQAAAQKAQQEMAEQADLQQLAQQYGNDYDGLIDAAAKHGHTEWALDITKKLQDGRVAGAQQRWEQTRASRAEIQSDLAEVQGADENTWPETSQRLAKKYPTLAPAFLRPFSPQLQQQLVSIGQSQDQWLQSIETGAKSVADGKTLKGFAEAYAGADTPEKRAVVDKMAEDSKAAGMKTYFPDVASAQGWLEKNAKADPEKAAKVGTFEDYVVRTYGPDPTPAQILAARKAYNQADDKALRPQVTIEMPEGGASNPDVKYWADQIQKDPTFATSPLIGGAANAGLRTAIAHEIASRGGSLDKITAQTKQMGETAKAILPHISTIEQEAKTLESRGLMGPIGSRWREFVHGTLRANELTTNAADAQMIGRFQADLGLMRSAVARAHGGARGGGSPTMIEHMKTIIQGGGDLPTFLGSMDAVRDWMQTYADDAKQDSGPKPTDGSTPPPASRGGTVRMRAPGGQMKDVPADKVEFYRSHGAVVVK